jgi:hypothetical protein
MRREAVPHAFVLEALTTLSPARSPRHNIVSAEMICRSFFQSTSSWA